jgi:hypothetical protein
MYATSLLGRMTPVYANTNNPATISICTRLWGRREHKGGSKIVIDTQRLSTAVRKLQDEFGLMDR